MTKEELLRINDCEMLEEELNKRHEFYSDLKNWDEDLIQHYIKLADISMEQFKNSFSPYFIPVDYEEEMNK